MADRLNEQLNPRLKVLSGKVDSQSVLTITPDNIANTGENLVTELKVELPTDILSTYRIYFEFLLPTKQYFISEPLAAVEEELEGIDDTTRQPYSYKAWVVYYKIPAFVGLIAGPCVVNLKATNDSVTIYKSKTTILTVDQSTNADLADRYFRGDLLDYIVMHKIDTMKYIEGWIHVYTTNPTTQEQIEITKFPVNPLFDSVDAAADWAKNSGESTVGQLVTVVFSPKDDEYAIDRVTGYFINPDYTLSHILTEGATSYLDLIDLPQLDTSSPPGVLSPVESEIITGTIQLASISKTGKSSDMLNDRGLSSLNVVSVTESSVEVPLNSYPDSLYNLILKEVIIINPLDSGASFDISVGQDQSWITLLSQSDIDITSSNTSYQIDQYTSYQSGDSLNISILNNSSPINIKVIYSYN